MSTFEERIAKAVTDPNLKYTQMMKRDIRM